jgi:hypothetical protein
MEWRPPSRRSPSVQRGSNRYARPIADALQLRRLWQRTIARLNSPAIENFRPARRLARTSRALPPPPHLHRHVLFRVLAYQLQADQLGDLDAETVRLLYRSGSPENLAVVKGMAVQNGGLWVQSPELELRDFPDDTPNRLRNARAKELSES